MYGARQRRYRSFGSLESPARTFIQLGIRQKRLKSVPVAWEGQFLNCLSDGLTLRKRVKNERSNIGAQCRKPGHRRRDHYRGGICSKFNGDIDGSGREKQGDQWNERLGDCFALQGYRSRKQRFINSLPVRSCSVDRTSEVTRSLESFTSSVRIPRAYFWKRHHSAFVGIPWEGFTGRPIRRREVQVVRKLTNRPVSAFQTSPGDDLTSGSGRSCDFHNTFNTGSSKLLGQHANETAAAFASDTTSPRAKNLRIPSMLRHECLLDLEVTLAHPSKVRGN